jgi:hypothetical protein
MLSADNFSSVKMLILLPLGLCWREAAPMNLLTLLRPVFSSVGGKYLAYLATQVFL